MARGLKVVLVLALLSVIPSPARSGELETVRFGVCLSLTGQFAAFGPIYLTGIKLRMETVNSLAAKNGYRLEMVIRDDESDPEKAATAARELIGEGVVGIIGSDSTDLTMAMIPVARQAGVALITPSATSPEIGRNGDGAFRVLYDDDFQGEALARQTLDNLNIRRAAIIVNERFSYCRSIAESFAKVFEEGGGRIVAVEKYDAELSGYDEFDFLPLLERVNKANPQVILLPNYADDVMPLVRQSLHLGMHAIFCGGDAWERSGILVEAGNNIIDSYYVGVVDEHARTPEMTRFLEMLDQSNEEHAELSSALGYDALTMLVAGLERGGRDRPGLVDGLYAISDLPLVTGVISIDRNGEIRKPAYIVRIVKRGGNFVREVVTEVRPRG